MPTLISSAEMIDDAFILYLFQLIEQLSNDPSDPYHYAIVRIVVCRTNAKGATMR